MLILCLLLGILLYCGITISGTAFQSDRTTNVGSGITIHLSINGGASSSVNTTAGGAYSFSATAASGAVICIFFANSPFGACILISNGSNVTGIPLYEGWCAVNPGNAGTSVTAANFTTAASNADTGRSQVFSGSPIVAHVNFIINTSATFAPGSGAAFQVQGDWLNLGTFTKSTSTITFQASGSVHNITSGGSSFATAATSLGVSVAMQDAFTASTALTIGSGTTFDLNGKNLTLTGATLTNSGTIKMQGAETLTAFTNDTAHSGTVNYTGSATYTSLIAGNSYAHLTFSGTGTFKLGAAVTMTGNLTIASGSHFDVSTSNWGVTVGGNWSNSGTFVQQSGTVTLNGTAQTISGSTTFYNFTANTTGDVITFTDGTTQTIQNAVTLQHVTLQGSGTGGWTIAMPYNQTIDHVTVSYSTATVYIAYAGSTSTDSGNNHQWNFGVYVSPIILMHL